MKTFSHTRSDELNPTEPDCIHYRSRDEVGAQLCEKWQLCPYTRRGAQRYCGTYRPIPKGGETWL